MRHFSQALPEGADRNDIARLLTHVADTIKKNNISNIKDISLNDLDNPDEPPSLTVFFEEGEFGYPATVEEVAAETTVELLDKIIVSAKLTVDFLNIVVDVDGSKKHARLYR